MTIESKREILPNGCGQTRVVSVFRRVGEACQYSIMNPQNGQIVFQSTSIGAPSYGFYALPSDAMRSAKRILKNLAQ